MDPSFCDMNTNDRNENNSIAWGQPVFDDTFWRFWFFGFWAAVARMIERKLHLHFAFCIWSTEYAVWTGEIFRNWKVGFAARRLRICSDERKKSISG